MDKLTKYTHVFCEHFNFCGTIEELSGHIEDIDELENFQVVTVCLTNLEPFCEVNDDFILRMVSAEIERQGCDYERSSESGDEMSIVEQLILEHIKVDYKAIMDKMPRLYYGDREEFQIDLRDFEDAN